jgi:hypothetical protein
LVISGVTNVEVEEVHRLEQHVAELRVADPGLEPPSHDVALEHPVHREVLPDVAQEVDRGQARRPVVVVDDRGGVRAVEADERLDLSAYPLAPVLDRIERVQRPLGALLRVTDLPGGPADQQQRAVAGELQPAGHENLHEVADVQARGGGVEAHVIGGGRPAVEQLTQLVEACRVLDEATPEQVVGQGVPPGRRGAAVGHGHRFSPIAGTDPYRVCRNPPRLGLRPVDRGGVLPWRCRI